MQVELLPCTHVDLDQESAGLQPLMNAMVAAGICEATDIDEGKNHLLA